ncbi:RNA-binding protein 5-A isoform X2 [Agrilus planipennis]|uniref:RNA-binding protein 5-A isoform X2 n=1 Tax=Agrilus planipennis TaxID=224129 RepID=A0A1W4WR29_AGRPL|nr:RNA-binding protein 5-A isoform X2 [Agrilus planipennis]
MERNKDCFRGKSMSISPDNRRISPDYIERSRSRSKSPHYRKHNGYKSHKTNRYEYNVEEKGRHDSDYDSDRSYGKRESPWEPRSNRRSRSRSREKDRFHRDRDYDSYKERDHRKTRDRRSHSNSRWERKSVERKARDRERSYRDDDRDSVDSERSPNGAVIGASGSEIIGYKSQPPNNTIMIRGLALHITENDIRQDIMQAGLMPKDIRLIRKKDTGTSRGFAFVEFTTLAEATRWMDMKQGILMLHDNYRAIMQYSIPKELCQSSEKPPSHKASSDWFCIKCGAQNFKRRDNCFKCHASRTESEEGGSGSDEVCNYATKTIMLRNLDALTTEDSVMQILNTEVSDLVKTISGVCIGRDPLTSTSRGICYLGTESTVDALALHGALANLNPPLTIDGKTVIISYCKYKMGDTKKAYDQAESAAFPNAAQPSTYALSDVDRLAEYSASRYAKTVVEYHQFYDYYKTYFTHQINNGHSITLQENQMDAANAAAAVAQSAIQQMQASKTFYDSTHMTVPTGTDGKKYPIPDSTKFTYDKSSGYYYDVTTGLYYDPNSTYYWNSVIQKYLYYDQDKLTYALAPAYDSSYTTFQTPVEITAEPETKKSKSEKQDKVKVAKKIAKDMERWAKTLNQRKETSTTIKNIDVGGALGIATTAAADIGYSVLEKKNGSNSSIVATSFKPEVPVVEAPVQATPLVAAYGGESESSGEDETPMDDLEFLDYTKLICNLCKRQLSSADALTKHAKLSNLHKQNLIAKKGGLSKSDSSGLKIVYRDRAKERRMKYGDTDEPQPSKLKEKYLKTRELVDNLPPPSASVMEPIGSDNVGNRLLQKMGWMEGQGLGKTNQGRTTIIQAEQRNSTVGLGNKSYSAVAGESYKDCVKKMMYARYQELSEKE